MRTHFLALTVTALALTGSFAACNCGPTPPIEEEDGGTGGQDGGGGADGGGETDAGDVDGGGTDDAGTTEDGGTTNDGGMMGCVPVSCGGQQYQCANCLDDDMDGVIDSEDPDCLGPCHNDESSFDIGIQAAKGGNCDSLECYYDTNAGRGNDDCYSSFRCDPLEPYPTCNYNAALLGTSTCPATQSTVCEDTCRTLTPNGCDCFGCCSVTMADGGFRDIFLGSEDVTGKNCTLDAVDDPTACRACTKNPSCEKECGTCQLCIGKDTLPPECFTADGGIIAADGGVDGGSAQCPGGEQPCGLPGQAACPNGQYCVTGCCVTIIN